MTDRIASLETQLADAADARQRIDALNALSRELSFGDAARAVGLAQQARQLSSEGDFANEPYRPGLAASLFNLARAYNQLGNYAESLACLLDALPHYENLGDEAGLMWLYNEFGRLYYFLSDYSNALAYYLKELELARKLEHTNRQAGTLHNIGLVHFSTNDYPQAIETMSEGLQIAVAAGDHWVEGFLLGGLAETYFHLKDYTQALAHGLRSLELARAAGIPNLVNGSLVAVSWTYFELSQYDQAQACLQEVLHSAQATGDKRGRGEALRAIGEQAARRERAAEALPPLEQALALAGELGEKAFIANCHLALSQAHKQLEAYQLALEHYEQYHALEKAVFDEKSDLRLKSLVVVHRLETTRKETEIYHLRNVMLQQEIEERRKAQDALEYMANHDPLTGLFNRRAFFHLGEIALERAQKTQQPISAIMLDFDRFKSVNDQYGHQAGDAVLSAIAEGIRQRMRGFDLLCRYGGEEFAILLPDVDETIACQIAERLRQSVAEQIIQAGDAAIRVTISLGAAQADRENCATLDELLALADVALYASKNAGRNQVTAFSQIGVVNRMEG